MSRAHNLIEGMLGNILKPKSEIDTWVKSFINSTYELMRSLRINAITHKNKDFYIYKIIDKEKFKKHVRMVAPGTYDKRVHYYNKYASTLEVAYNNEKYFVIDEEIPSEVVTKFGELKAHVKDFEIKNYI